MESFLKKFKIGDIVITHMKGIHIITRIERRFITESIQQYQPYRNKSVGTEYESLIFGKRLFASTGAISKGKEWSRDERLCDFLTEEWFQKKLDKLEVQRQAIVDLMEKFKGLK